MNENQEITMNNENFSANLALLRKGRGMSQEQLAEHLGVSRQSVSKWESGVCLPELATLDLLCTLFGCTLDTLLRGSVRQQETEALDAYDAEWNTFSGQTTFGVASILVGVSLSAFCLAASLPENIAGFVLLLGVLVGVVTFVASGIRHDSFEKAHPAAEIVYPPERAALFARKFPWLMAGGVGALLADVALLALIEPLVVQRLGQARGEPLAGAVFMLILAAAVSVLVWGGMQQGKYTDPDEQRRLQADPGYARREKLVGRAMGVLWLLVILVFLLWGFLADGWGINWVVFVVGGLLSAVIAVALGNDDQ